MNEHNLKMKLNQFKNDPDGLLQFLSKFSQNLGYTPQVYNDWTVFWPHPKNNKMFFAMCGETVKYINLTNLLNGKIKSDNLAANKNAASNKCSKVKLYSGWYITQINWLDPASKIMVLKCERGVKYQLVRFDLNQNVWLDSAPMLPSAKKMQTLAKNFLNYAEYSNDHESRGDNKPAYSTEKENWLYTVRGRTRTLATWAKLASKSVDEMMERIHQLPLAEALTVSSKYEEAITIGSVTMTLSEWLHRHKITRYVYAARVKNGWTRRHAMTTNIGHIPHSMPITSNGETHTLNEWAVIYRESPTEILRRLPEGLHLYSKGLLFQRGKKITLKP